MLKSFGKFPAARRCVPVAAACLFLLFQVVSQPHRVHHVFETPRHGHSDMVLADAGNGHDHPANIPDQRPCVIQSAAKKSQTDQVKPVQILSVQMIFGTIGRPSARWLQSFSFSLFFQRAPPAQRSLLNS
jgi:hypothetical protein